MMRHPLVILVCLGTVAYAAWTAEGYGKSWEFGRFGMARILVAGDGVSHLDGTPVNEFELAVAKTGYEEEGRLLVLFMATLAFAAVIFYITTVRRRFNRAFNAELRRLLVAGGMMTEVEFNRLFDAPHGDNPRGPVQGRH
jgi:hypothetical protein